MSYKTVIIGATSGIGREVARILWKEGATVGVAGRRTDRLRAFCEECGQRASYATIDVTASDAGDKLVELAETVGGADMILLCSGIGSQNPELKPEIESDTVNTNVAGFTRMIDSAFNYFKGKGGGHIVAVTSIAGTKGLGIAAAYSATKRYQNTYIQCLAQLSAMQGYALQRIVRDLGYDSECIDYIYPNEWHIKRGSWVPSKDTLKNRILRFFCI